MTSRISAKRVLQCSESRWRFCRSYVILRNFNDNELLSFAAQEMAYRNMVPVAGTKIPSLAVTEFITQYDELSQLKQFMSGLSKPETAAMRLGTDEHQKSERKANDVERKQGSILRIIETPDTMELAINGGIVNLGISNKGEMRMITYLDKVLYLAEAENAEPNRVTVDHEEPKLHGTYLEDVKDFEELESLENTYPLVREVPVYGVTDSEPKFELRGIIDGIRIIPQSGLEIIETKTTHGSFDNPILLQSAYHQASTYHFLFSELLRDVNENPEVILEKFHVSNGILRNVILVPETLQRIQKAHHHLAKNIGMSERVRIEVIRNKRMSTFDSLYDRETLKQMMRCRTDLFLGKRMPFDHFLGDASRHN